jgi:hypothetical protein
MRSLSRWIDESRLTRGARPQRSDFNPGAIGDQPRLGRGSSLDLILPLREAENHFSYKTPAAGLSNRATMGFLCGYDEADVKKNTPGRMEEPEHLK